jgi:hypothetical protein
MQPSPWITCPSTRLLNLFKSRKSIGLWSLPSTRCCRKGKHKWISPFTKWFPCLLCILPSRLMSWRWSRHFRLGITRGKRYSMYLPWIGRDKRKFLSPTLTLGMPINVLKMRNLRSFFLEIWISSFYQVVCFLCGMATIGCKPGCLTSNVCIMGILNGIIQWIPLCSTTHIALWSSSWPWHTWTSEFWTPQWCFEFSLYVPSKALMFLIELTKFLLYS